MNNAFRALVLFKYACVLTNAQKALVFFFVDSWQYDSTKLLDIRILSGMGKWWG